MIAVKVTLALTYSGSRARRGRAYGVARLAVEHAIGLKFGDS